MTVSGHDATFISGGKMLLPQPKKDGTTPLEWRQYAQVQLTPRGAERWQNISRFNSKYPPSITGDSVQVGKESYPGLTTIVAATSSEFNEGQTVVFLEG